MIKLNKLNSTIFFTILFSPILAYIYVVWLRLPKTLSIFLTFLFLGYGLVFIAIKNYNLIFPTFAKFLLAFAVYRAVSIYVFGGNRHFLTQIYHYILHFSIFLTVIVIYNSHFSDRFIRNCILVIKITVIVSAVVSIIQVFDNSFFNATDYFQEGEPTWDQDPESLYRFRRASIYGFIEPLAMGLSFIPLLSVLIGYLLYTNQRFIIFLIAGGIAAFLSNTRFIMVGFLILAFQMGFSNKLKGKQRLKYIAVFIVSIVVIGFMLRYLGYDFTQWYEERLLSEGDITETTRYKAIDTFLRFFPQNPLFGVGGLTEDIRKASMSVGSSHIHVGYLSHLVYYGVVGCFFLYGFWFLLVRRLHRTAKNTGYWGSFFGFLTFLWAFATMSQSSIFYYGIFFCLVFDKYFSDKYYQQKRIL